MDLLIVGDVHSNVEEYYNLVKNNISIQVGDLGNASAHKWHLKTMNNDQHKVNFGNHDDPAFLNSPHSCGDFSFYFDLMTIRGAYSVDRDYRIDGYNWWPEEQMTYEQMQACIDAYVDKKPRIIVSHDCPAVVRRIMFNIHERSITSVGMEHMFSNHQPDMWIFGHHHVSKSEAINGTRFICLDELEPFLIGGSNGKT